MSNDAAINPVYGPTNPTPEEYQHAEVKRMGTVIGLAAEKEQYYRDLHSGTWPSVLQRLKTRTFETFPSIPPSSTERNTCSATGNTPATITKPTCRQYPRIRRQSDGGRKPTPARFNSQTASREPNGAKWKWCF